MSVATAVASDAEAAGLPRRPKRMVDVRDVAEQLDCSTRHVHRMSEAGKMPSLIRLGSLVRWRQSVIDEWIAAGCPAMDD